jgi:cold shock CspA family protein
MTMNDRGKGRRNRGFDDDSDDFPKHGKKGKHGRRDKRSFDDEFPPELMGIPPADMQPAMPARPPRDPNRPAHSRPYGDRNFQDRTGRSENRDGNFRPHGGQRSERPQGQGRPPQGDRPRPERGPRQNGTVKFFNMEKGFGFISPESGDPDVFVHISAVEKAGLSSLTEGQRISFETEADRKGKGFKAIFLREAEG